MILSVHRLCKRYNQGQDIIVALDEISFNMNKGETLAILGPSGSGKTTLLSLLAGLEEISSGTVQISDHDIHQLSEEDLTQFRSKNVGIIFQQFHLMPHLTALENVRLPLDIQNEADSDKTAARALAAVGLEARRNHFPRELSGGECQRVAIARAIVTQPTILLADEPSGNLDADTGEMVMNLIFDLVSTNRMTLILVTHNLDLAKRCQRQICLKSGRIE
jgi:putative ABC transport system ATP-binding protein